MPCTCPVHKGNPSPAPGAESRLRAVVGELLKLQGDDVIARLGRLTRGETLEKGGAGSGNFGHAGRPGEVGGSGEGGDVDFGKSLIAKVEERYPVLKKGERSDGRYVLDKIPNTGSIGSSFNTYKVLPGVRDIPMTAFTGLSTGLAYSVTEEERIVHLANAIKESGEISPLIVVVDDKWEKEGLYVLEGSHRIDALTRIGAKSFPAIVVIDLDSIPVKTKSVLCTLPLLSPKWDERVVRATMPVLLGVFKAGGDDALKQIRKFPRAAKGMAWFPPSMIEGAERVAWKGEAGGKDIVDGKEGRWVTMRGSRVFIREGQSAENAAAERFGEEGKLPTTETIPVLYRGQDTAGGIQHNRTGDTDPWVDLFPSASFATNREEYARQYGDNILKLKPGRFINLDDPKGEVEEHVAGKINSYIVNEDMVPREARVLSRLIHDSGYDGVKRVYDNKDNTIEYIYTSGVPKDRLIKSLSQKAKGPNDEEGRWVTMRGRRVFIRDGQDPKEALEESLGKKKPKKEDDSNNRNEDNETRESDIAVGSTSSFFSAKQSTYEEAVKTIRGQLRDKDISYQLEQAEKNQIGNLDVSELHLSKDEIVVAASIISSYCSKSYEPINGYLRTGEVPKQFARFISNDSIMAECAVMKNAVDNILPKSKIDTVWRGINNSKTFTPDLWDKMCKSGSIFSDNGFVSSTTNKQLAKEGAEKLNPHIMRISGAKQFGADVSKCIYGGGEEEVIFSSQTLFRTDKYDQKTDTLWVTAIGSSKRGKKSFYFLVKQQDLINDKNMRFSDFAFFIVDSEKSLSQKASDYLSFDDFMDRYMADSPVSIASWIDQPEVVQAAEREAYQFAQQINQTTADALREVIVMGMENGDSIKTIANSISNLSDEWAEGWRAEMIARTETARVYTSGRIEAWRATGVVKRKVWSAAGDACLTFDSFILKQEDGKIVSVKIGTIKEGDYVIGGSGQPCRVTGISSKEHKGHIVIGDRFSATPDHMFQTVDGNWKAIGEYAPKTCWQVIVNFLISKSKNLPTTFQKILGLSTILSCDTRSGVPVNTVTLDDKVPFTNKKVNNPLAIHGDLRLKRNLVFFQQGRHFQLNPSLSVKGLYVDDIAMNGTIICFCSFVRMKARGIFQKLFATSSADTRDFFFPEGVPTTFHSNSMCFIGTGTGTELGCASFLKNLITYRAAPISIRRDVGVLSHSDVLTNTTATLGNIAFVQKGSELFSADLTGFIYSMGESFKLMTTSLTTYQPIMFFIHVGRDLRRIKTAFAHFAYMYFNFHKDILLHPKLQVKPFKGLVYDIQVEGEHCFTLANGLVAHNCPFCRELDGTVVDLDTSFFRVGEAATAEWNGQQILMDINYMDVDGPPLHPNCLVDRLTPIFTDEGWRSIVDMKVGDKVLTHQGRFRKVTKVHNIPLQKITCATIRMVVGSKRRKVHLKVTEDHPVLVKGKGWVAAKDLVAGDALIMLASKCVRCGKPVPYFSKYCSASCCSKDITDRQWSDPKHRELMSRKTHDQLLREYSNGTRDKKEITRKAREQMTRLVMRGERVRPFCLESVKEKTRQRNRTPESRVASSKRMIENNPACMPGVRERMTASYLRTMREHPEKHPNFIMAQKGFMSSIERKMKELLEANEIPFVAQQPILQYFVDFAIPGLKIAIECDGEHWHDKTSRRDWIRQRRIENEGWTVIRFTGNEINKRMDEVSDKILRIAANHSGQYRFIPCIVAGVEIKKREDRGTLYNLSVEQDESFIAKGIIVHNCRCAIVGELDYEALDQGGETLEEILAGDLSKGMEEDEEDGRYEDGRWVTMRGRRVFIQAGQEPADALEESLGESREKNPPASEEELSSIDEITSDYKEKGVHSLDDMRIVAYRIGGLDPSHGIFLSGDRKGAEAYASIHEGDVVKEYEVSLKKVLVVGHQNDLTMRYFGKHYGVLADTYIRRNNFRGLDRAIMQKAKGEGFQGIILTRPAPPAKNEIMVFSPRSLAERSGKKNLSQKAKNSNDEEGRWVTMRGRRVFVVEGQDPKEALQESLDALRPDTPARFHPGPDKENPAKGGKWTLANGKPLPEHVGNIRPDLTDVRVSMDPEASMIWIGKDSAGRDQKKYRASITDRNTAAKFARTHELIEKKPSILKENENAIAKGDKVEEALVTKLIFATGMRPGSTKDTKAEKQAYGATTLFARNVRPVGDGVELRFTGKSGKFLTIPVEDRSMAKVLLERKARGGKLFGTSEAKVLGYVHTLDGGKFKTKDIRTAVGTETALAKIKQMSAPTSEKAYKAAVKEVAVAVSAKLGNTPTVALQSYISPVVFAPWRQVWGGEKLVAVKSYPSFDKNTEVQFGDVEQLPDWRKVNILDDEDPDDEELETTPQDVIDVLGFDPLEFTNETETTKDETTEKEPKQ